MSSATSVVLITGASRGIGVAIATTGKPSRLDGRGWLMKPFNREH